MADTNHATRVLPSPNESSDHVSLRVTYLLTGNPRPPHSLGQVALDTTVGTLKERIQSELPEHPLPHDQRLIYQGRPLLRNEVTLRQVLRLDNNTPVGPLPYTLHIIIQSHQSAPQPPRPEPAQPTFEAQNPLPVQRPTPTIAAQTSATSLQDALSRIQRSIESNRADLRSVQQRIAIQHHDLAIPTAPTIPMPLHMPQLPPMPPNFVPGHINMPNVQAAFDQHQQLLRQHGGTQWPLSHFNAAAHGQPPIYPHVASPGPTPAQVQANLASNTTPPSHHQVQEFQGPNGERMTIVTDHTSLRIPFQRPASAPGPPSARPAIQQPGLSANNHVRHGHLSPNPQQPQPPNPRIHMPQQSLPSLHLPYPFTQTRAAPAQSSTATAWIVSSPTGPHALVLAPNHGYFSSPNIRAPSIPNPTGVPAVAADPSQAIPTATSTPPNPHTQIDGPGQINTNGALVRQDRRPAAPAVAHAQPNPQDNDLFTFLIQRGWLFLRLYLFMFVFSEPGTWKRWLMIVLATIICLQPRNGPLARALTAARQHFDDLIGPPAQRPQREVALRRRPIQGNQHGPDAIPAIDRAAQRPAHVRGAIQMTPEEAAARLVRERQDQHRGFWRNALYRVEQSAALFLASLVPGVGERHIRAREEARREIQEIEEQRRRAEDEAAASSQPDGQEDVQHEVVSGAPEIPPEIKTDGHTSIAPSNTSGVEVRDTSTAEASELRNRAA